MIIDYEHYLFYSFSRVKIRSRRHDRYNYKGLPLTQVLEPVLSVDFRTECEGDGTVIFPQ